MPRSLIVFCLAMSVPLIACGPPVSVHRVQPRDVYARDSASILDTGKPSRFTEIVLQRAALDQKFEEDPRLALKVLYHRAVQEGDSRQILALAEMSFLLGSESDNRDDYLGAAVFAYFYLFGPEAAEMDGWDPRTRIAADVYNRSLPRAFASEEQTFEPHSERRTLPVGSIAVTVPDKVIRWPDGIRFGRFLPADEFEVDGIASRYRRPGLGAPLIAERTSEPQRENEFIPALLAIPATAFLRVHGDIADVRTGQVSADLELLDPLKEQSIVVRGKTVPLEAQPTTAIAWLLGDAPIWNSELAAFLRGDENSIPERLTMLEPWVPGKIPVVFVHGTASSSGRWAGLYNELHNDPLLGDQYQFWFFAYNSGNPIAFSAAKLRQALASAVEQLDPEGHDPALRQMVLAGHSQGGLLVRLAISDSTEIDYEALGMRFPDEKNLHAEDIATLREVLFFRPSPSVTRVIFLATPHQGSFMAGGILGEIGSGLVSVSQRLLSVPWRVVVVPAGKVAKGESPLAHEPLDVRTAVDNMAPDSRFVRLLHKLPMNSRVPKHSIVGVRGVGRVEDGNDGVVEYESAHLDEAVSEAVVRSSHSLQSNPSTVGEVKRILREHAGELALGRAAPRSGVEPSAPY